MKGRMHVIVAFAAVLILLGASSIGAHSPENWLAESRVLFWTVPLAFIAAYYSRMSRFSVLLIGLYISLHILAMHYNYGEVPFGHALGRILGTGRNMYDRFVHFMFGFLLFVPVREFLAHSKKILGFYLYLVPVVFIAAASAVYEILEWRTVSGLSTSVAYLFIGGSDPFDAEKDMLCAIVGAILALVIMLAREGFRRLSKSPIRIE